MYFQYQDSFRTMPSCKPIKSPSPDFKSNIIKATKVANPTELSPPLFNHVTTPVRNKPIHPQTTKNSYQSAHKSIPPTEAKYFTRQQSSTFLRSETDHDKFEEALRQKDETIIQLQNMIKIMGGGIMRESSSNDLISLQSKVKVLTIENQKLVDIIERLQMQKQVRDNSIKSFEEQQRKIAQKTQYTLDKTSQQTFEETKQQTTKQLRYVQSENSALKKQNQRLMNMIKETSQTKIQKMSLGKIKQQYQESLKQYKENVYHEAENMFETIRETLQEINHKLQRAEQRIQVLTNTLRQFSNPQNVSRKARQVFIHMPKSQGSQTERETYSVYPPEGSKSQRDQGDSNSPHFQADQRHKSEIYIEEGPASSNSSQGKDTHQQKSKRRSSEESKSKDYSRQGQAELEKLKRNHKREMNRIQSRVKAIQQSHSVELESIRYENEINLQKIIKDYEKQISDLITDNNNKESALREKVELLDEISRLKNIILELEANYQEEKCQLRSQGDAKIQRRENENQIVEENRQLQQALKEQRKQTTRVKRQIQMLAKKNETLLKEVSNMQRTVSQYSLEAPLFAFKEHLLAYQSMAVKSKEQINQLTDLYQLTMGALQDKMKQLSKTEELLQASRKQQSLFGAQNNLMKERIQHLENNLIIHEKELAQKDEIYRDTLAHHQRIQNDLMQALKNKTPRRKSTGNQEEVAVLQRELGALHRQLDDIINLERLKRGQPSSE